MKKTAISRYEKIAPEIYRIILPLPGKKPGPINVYLFMGKQMTLLDTGILRTMGTLRSALDEIGTCFSDIRQIILTHGHFDHYGAARRIVRGAGGGIVIAAHAEDKEMIEHGMQVPRKHYAGFLRLMGVPYIHQILLDIMRRAISVSADHATVGRTLSDGEKIQMGDYEATVIAVPGHTGGSIGLFLKKEKMLFSGDHIIGHISPNAFVMLEPDTDLPTRLSQAEFYDSIGKIEALSPRIVYSGHGDPVTDLARTTAQYRKRFSQRQKKILSIMDSREYTVYGIVRKLFPDLGGLKLPFEIFLAVSEVFTHIQVLRKEGRAAWEIRQDKLYVRQIR
ncbi:MAG: MBL fold metallo-hydrolase [Spirochaetes bacterium]|nr:MBL fold metallo-hydrolase [Spirochaetota bacterium]